MLVAACLLAWAPGAQGGWKASAPVTVCMERGSDPRIGAEARSTTSLMFEGMGVRLKWHLGTGECEAGGIRVAVSERTPSDLFPGSLAFAMPFAVGRGFNTPQSAGVCHGVFHICVFRDRIETMGDRLAPRLLAHVLTHELTHVLQGSDHHAPEGVMKARFNQNDYAAMLRRPLALTRDDVDLLHHGVDSWMTRNSDVQLARKNEPRVGTAEVDAGLRAMRQTPPLPSFWLLGMPGLE
jgi:hypothetical protein